MSEILLMVDASCESMPILDTALAHESTSGGALWTTPPPADRRRSAFFAQSGEK